MMTHTRVPCVSHGLEFKNLNSLYPVPFIAHTGYIIDPISTLIVLCHWQNPRSWYRTLQDYLAKTLVQSLLDLGIEAGTTWLLKLLRGG